MIVVVAFTAPAIMKDGTVNDEIVTTTVVMMKETKGRVIGSHAIEATHTEVEIAEEVETTAIGEEVVTMAIDVEVATTVTDEIIDAVMTITTTIVEAIDHASGTLTMIAQIGDQDTIGHEMTVDGEMTTIAAIAEAVDVALEVAMMIAST